jgi:hypothetical protein
MSVFINATGVMMMAVSMIPFLAAMLLVQIQARRPNIVMILTVSAWWHV